MPQYPYVAPYGGTQSALDVTAATVVKAAPGKLYRVVIVSAGTAGNLTINDTTTVGGAATANQILTIAYGSLSAGQVIFLEWPCQNGIVISAVPTGAQVSVSYA